MKIRRPYGITGFELGLVFVLGVVGGLYIWKPTFAERKVEEGKLKTIPINSIKEQIKQ